MEFDENFRKEIDGRQTNTHGPRSTRSTSSQASFYVLRGLLCFWLNSFYILGAPHGAISSPPGCCIREVCAEIINSCTRGTNRTHNRHYPSSYGISLSVFTSLLGIYISNTRAFFRNLLEADMMHCYYNYNLHVLCCAVLC